MVVVPLMIVIMLMRSRRKVMDTFIMHWTLKQLGWLATAVKAAAVMFVTSGQ